MDFLATPLRRRILFTALYLSEGAPIGFLWLALPTWLRAAGTPIEQIAWLGSILVVPWTFKFVWAPTVDVLRSSRWTLKHWVLGAQIVMGLALCPLLWFDLHDQLSLVTPFLIVHAFAAATQDVAIDALCISVTAQSERGRLNGWMQSGMLAGRAAMGGGALIMSSHIGDTAVVVLLIAVTTFSGALLLMSRLPEGSADLSMAPSLRRRVAATWAKLGTALRQRNTQLGLLFALVAPAAFKSFEVVVGPFLIDREYSESEIGQFTAVVMIGAMVAGSVIGGVLADYFRRRAFVSASLYFVIAMITLLALLDLAFAEKRGPHLSVAIGLIAFGIGLFTVAAYAMYMDFTIPEVAATQFSAFMGATNGCEAWSTLFIGMLIAAGGYPFGMVVLCGVSALALPLLAFTESV
ncbi:MAG: MFS transporter [Pirellulales bacterium]